MNQMNCLNFFIAIDLTPMEVSQVEWRNALMRLFFMDISIEGKKNLSHLFDIGDEEMGRVDYCDGWRGVFCDRVTDEVRSMQIDEFMHGTFNIRALPPSTTGVTIRRCQQAFQIQTRSFPRNLKWINLGGNKIRGRIDLTTFPAKLEDARFWWNRLTGPITLEHLPRNLKNLSLRGNRIRQATVWYDNLPEGIDSIDLFAPKSGDRNVISEVRASNLGNTTSEKGVFKGIQEADVH